jgi:hypothetical protein
MLRREHIREKYGRMNLRKKRRKVKTKGKNGERWRGGDKRGNIRHNVILRGFRELLLP